MRLLLLHPYDGHRARSLRLVPSRAGALQALHATSPLLCGRAGHCRRVRRSDDGGDSLFGGWETVYPDARDV